MGKTKIARLFPIISIPVDQNFPDFYSFAAGTQCIFHALPTSIKWDKDCQSLQILEENYFSLSPHTSLKQQQHYTKAQMLLCSNYLSKVCPYLRTMETPHSFLQKSTPVYVDPERTWIWLQRIDSDAVQNVYYAIGQNLTLLCVVAT